MMQKVYFSRLMRVYVVFNNVSDVYLVQVSLLFIDLQGLRYFFRYQPLLHIGWRIVQILRQHRRKTTNTAPTTFSEIQSASQAAKKYFVLGWPEQPKQDKNLLYRHDEPNEPTKEGAPSFILH